MRLPLLLSLILTGALTACATGASQSNVPYLDSMPPEYAEWPAAARSEGIEPPKVIRRVDPDPVRPVRDSMAAVEAAVDETGRILAVWYLDGDPHWSRAVGQAFARWQLEPATQNGKPIAVRFRITANRRVH